MGLITIIIVDDHKLLREAWSHLLNKDARFKVVAECDSAESAIETVKIFQPHIVLLDIHLPGISGIEAVPLILQSSPSSGIIGISQQTSPKYARRMMQKGAKGYVTKNSSTDEMIESIIAVYSGKNFICRYVKDLIAGQLTGETLSENKLDSLSQRELEIIELLKKGLASKEIADVLFISTKTVEVHRYNILRKLDLKNTAALIDFIHKH
jgi:two-component system invasion response regulator UvrY